MKCFSLITGSWLGCSLIISPIQAAEPKPLQVLLITGGCCHDYATQKEILKQGLEARANVVVTQIHSGDNSTKPPLAIYGNADYAKGYDVVIHDECAADINDPAVVRRFCEDRLEAGLAMTIDARAMPHFSRRGSHPSRPARKSPRKAGFVELHWCRK